MPLSDHLIGRSLDRPISLAVWDQEALLDSTGATGPGWARWNTWAAVDYRGEALVDIAGLTGRGQSRVYRVPWEPRVSTQARLLDRGEAWDISEVEILGRNRGLLLRATRLVGGAIRDDGRGPDIGSLPLQLSDFSDVVNQFGSAQFFFGGSDTLSDERGRAFNWNLRPGYSLRQAESGDPTADVPPSFGPFTYRAEGTLAYDLRRIDDLGDGINQTASGRIPRGWPWLIRRRGGGPEIIRGLVLDDYTTFIDPGTLSLAGVLTIWPAREVIPDPANSELWFLPDGRFFTGSVS